MRVLFTAAILVAIHSLLNCSPAFSQERWRLLTPRQINAYHACLTAAWIEEYCHGHAWGVGASYDRTYSACVLADGGWKYPLNGRDNYNTEDYCWSRARGLLR